MGWHRFGRSMAMSQRRGVVMVMKETEMRNVQGGEGEGGRVEEVAIGSRSCCAGERLT